MHKRSTNGFSGLLLTLALALGFVTSDPSSVAADDVGVGYSFRTGVATNYIWRGSPMYPDLFTPSWITNFSLNVTNLGPGTGYVGMWTGISLLDGHAWPVPFIGYTAVHEALWIDVSYGVYFSTQLQPVDQQHNAQLSVSYGIGDHVRPRIMVAADPFTVQGVYAQLGCQFAFAAGPVSFLFDVYSGVSEYRDVPFDLQDVSLDATVSYALEPNVSIGIDGSVAYAKRYDTVSPSAGVFIAFNR